MCYTKDFLRFWMIDIHREGRSQQSASQKGHKAHPTGVHGNWGWDHGGDKVHRNWGESALLRLLVAWAARAGKAQNEGPTESTSLWNIWNPSEFEQLKPGKCTQLRARSLESSLEPEQCRRGKHTPALSGGKPSVAGKPRELPTQASDICLQRPSLPTARLNKRT